MGIEILAVLIPKIYGAAVPYIININRILKSSITPILQNQWAIIFY